LRVGAPGFGDREAESAEIDRVEPPVVVEAETAG
jgi:hypothetical protein